MKLLVTATTFPRWKNDSEPGFVYDLSESLAQRGFEVIALVPHHRGARRKERMGRVEVIRFPYFFSRFEKLCYDGGILSNVKKHWYAKFLMPLLVLSETIYTIRIAGKAGVDAIHAHWIVPQGFVAAIAKKITGIPYVTTAHAGDVFPLKKWKWFGRFALKNASYCTANSAATMKAVLDVAKISNFEVIPMGVDVRAFSPGKKAKAARKRLSAGPLILSLGRLAGKKGLVYLINAMPEILRKIPKARLVIAGDGPEREMLERRSRELGLGEKIVFAGRVSGSRKRQLYSAADAFVLPSIVTADGDTEGLGVVLLEAMASGTPVIGSNVGGIPDVIKHNRTGLLVPQRDSGALAAAIARMLKDRKLRKKLAGNALAHVRKRFSWPVVTDEFERLFKAVRRRE